MKNSKPGNEKMYEQLAERVLERFSSVEHWKKSWQNPTPTLPYNATTGERYKGYNAIALLMSSIEQNFTDPRWMTYKQAKDADVQVKRGAKSTMIGYFERTKITEETQIPKGLWLPKDAQEQLKEALAEKGIFTYGDLMNQVNPVSLVDGILPQAGRKVSYLLSAIEDGNAFDIVSKTYHVFNAQQIEGLPEIDLTPAAVESAREKQLHLKSVENIIDNSGVMLDIRDNGNPTYYPGLDTVEMPSPSRFESVYEYYASFMHELAHATKHPNRENREKLDYAREELVAEFASMLINTGAGLKMSEAHFDNHAAYLKSWLKHAEDPRQLFNIIKDAGRAAEYVLELGQSPDKEINPERKALNDSVATPQYHEFKNIIIQLVAENRLDARDGAEKLSQARTKGLKEAEKEEDQSLEL